MSYRLVEKQVIYDGKKLRLELHHLEDDEADGGGKRQRKEVVVHPGAVVILAFDPAGRVLLIRNRRYAVGDVLIELPAGTLEKHEEPINGAGRELLEETGYLAGRLVPLGAFYPSPGVLSEKMYAFAAYDLQESEQALEEAEEIEVMPTEWPEAIRMIGDGRIQDGKTIATLLKFERFQRGEK